jgi:hypothetical protein
MAGGQPVWFSWEQLGKLIQTVSATVLTCSDWAPISTVRCYGSGVVPGIQVRVNAAAAGTTVTSIGPGPGLKTGNQGAT